MKENGRAIQEQMANSRSSMARERERQSEEKLAYFLAEEERLAEQEEIRRRHEQQLQAQRAQERKENVEREVEECRRRMKEKEELTKAVLVHREQFAVKYCDSDLIIQTLSKTCKDQQAFNVIFTTHVMKIRDLLQRIEAFDEKIRVIIEKKKELFARKCKNIFVKCFVYIYWLKRNNYEFLEVPFQDNLQIVT